MNDDDAVRGSDFLIMRTINITLSENLRKGKKRKLFYDFV